MACPNMMATLLEPLIKITWELRHFPDEWNNGYIINLPKKGDLSDCKNWRGITLLNTINKLVTTILYQRLIEKQEPLLRKEQAGFRPHRSCVDQINTLRIVVEQSLEYRSPLYMIFIDFERAFDSLKHTAIWQTLTEWEVPTKVVNIIRNYIINQHVKSSIETGKAKSIPMRNGVKQGCALSPLLFNIVLDTALSKANDTQRGIRWTLTDRLEDLDYADDICLLAHTFNHIRTKLQRLHCETAKVSLKIKISKTKEIRIHTPNNQPLLLNDQQTEQVYEFPYLGSIISKDNGGTDRDVAERIKKAQGTFRILNTVWRSTTYSNNTKSRIFNTNVKSILLYGCETWKFTKTIIHQLQVLVNRCIRRILKIFWPVQISNQELW
jgi:sorting nexin-29